MALRAQLPLSEIVQESIEQHLAALEEAGGESPELVREAHEIIENLFLMDLESLIRAGEAFLAHEDAATRAAWEAQVDRFYAKKNMPKCDISPYEKRLERIFTLVKQR